MIQRYIVLGRMIQRYSVLWVWWWHRFVRDWECIGYWVGILKVVLMWNVLMIVKAEVVWVKSCDWVAGWGIRKWWWHEGVAHEWKKLYASFITLKGANVELVDVTTVSCHCGECIVELANNCSSIILSTCGKSMRSTVNPVINPLHPNAHAQIEHVATR